MDSHREQPKHCEAGKFGAARRDGKLPAIKKTIDKEQKKRRLHNARWPTKKDGVRSANNDEVGDTSEAEPHCSISIRKRAYEDFVKKNWPGLSRYLMQTKKDLGRLGLGRRELPYIGQLEAVAKDPKVHLPRGKEAEAKLELRYDSGQTMCLNWRLVYLLLDAGTPGLFDGCSLRTFLRALFYVGKGTVTRPLEHLEQAKTYLLKRLSSRTSPCAERIVNIWKNGDGVIVLPVITKVCNDDAECREAAIISLQMDGLTNLLNSSRGVFTGLTGREQTELGILQLIRAFELYRATTQRRWYLWDLPLKPDQLQTWHLVCQAPCHSDVAKQGPSSPATHASIATARLVDSDKAIKSITKLAVRMTAVHPDHRNQEHNLRVSSSVKKVPVGRQATQRTGEVAAASTYATTGTAPSHGTVFEAASQQILANKLRASNDFYGDFFERTVVDGKILFKCLIDRCGYTIIAEDEPRNRFSLHFRQKHAEALCANERRPGLKKAVVEKVTYAQEDHASSAHWPYYALLKDKHLAKQRSYKYLETKLRKNSEDEALLLAGVGELEERRQAMLRAERRMRRFVELTRTHSEELRHLIRQGLSFNSVLQRLGESDAEGSPMEADDLHDPEEEAEEKGWYIIDYSAFFAKSYAAGITSYRCRMQRCNFTFGSIALLPSELPWKFRDHFADKHRVTTSSQSQKACTYWQEWPQIKELERKQELSMSSGPSTSRTRSSSSVSSLHSECMWQLLETSSCVSTAVPLMDGLQSGASVEEIICLLEDKLPLRLQQKLRQSHLEKIALLEEQLIGQDLMPVDNRQFFAVNGKGQCQCMFVDCEAAFSGYREEELHALTKAHCESVHFS